MAHRLSNIISVVTSQNMYSHNFRDLTVLSEEPCVAQLTVKEEHCGEDGHLNGGFTASIVDILSGCHAVMSRGPCGMTSELSVTSFAPARPGDVLLFESTLIGASRATVSYRVDVRDAASGAQVAEGRHTMIVTDGEAQRLADLVARTEARDSKL